MLHCSSWDCISGGDCSGAFRGSNTIVAYLPGYTRKLICRPVAAAAGQGLDEADIELVAELNGEEITRTNARKLYWSAAQQLAHLASGGAVVRPGDLLGTGTISGGDQTSGGSVMEMGRPFLEDGDEIVITGRAGDVALGEVRGRIVS